jgi:hypothetical protein
MNFILTMKNFPIIFFIFSIINISSNIHEFPFFYLKWMLEMEMLMEEKIKKKMERVVMTVISCWSLEREGDQSTDRPTLSTHGNLIFFFFLILVRSLFSFY